MDTDPRKFSEHYFVTELSTPVRVAVFAVLGAGTVAQWDDRMPRVKAGDGHRSVVTAGDSGAEAFMVKSLLSVYPQALILSEEDADNPNMLSKNNPTGILEAEVAFVIDPIDGTAPYAGYLGTWCVSIGVLSRGEIIGGAVYAPDLNGGMLVFSEKGLGTTLMKYCLLPGRTQISKIPHFTSSTKVKKARIGRGVDTDLYRLIGDLVSKEIAPSVNMTAVCNSGILGLTQVACGQLTAVIQMPQKSWDWAGAYRAVLETGRIVSFFRLLPDQGAPGSDMLVEVERYDFNAFTYAKQNRLGFVAGEPDMVRRIMERMPRKGYNRTNPETVAGVWKDK